MKYPNAVAPGECIRPLGNMETLMAVGGYYSSFNTIQTLWLSSKQPINPNDVHKAISQVVEKTHLLQICIQWSWIRPWYKWMKETDYDFKVEEDDVLAVIYTQLHQPYDMEKGPLWRVRLIPIQKQDLSDSYQAVLIISVQHCITDGFTNMHICRDLMEVLNASMMGRVYEVPLRPIIPAAADFLMTSRDCYYRLKYFWTKFFGTILMTYNSKLYFHGALKQPQTKLALTKFLREKFSTEETKELISHCRENGVKVNSCIMAAANLALLKTVQQCTKYNVDGVYINSVNTIDMRRYFPMELKQAAGCHISVEENEMLITSCATKNKENFWSLVKTFQKNLNESLNIIHVPIRNAPLMRMYTIMVHVNHALTRHGLKNRTDNHITSTNMGNLKTLLPAKYNGPVEITDFCRTGSFEYGGNPFTLVCHTFDDRLMVSIDYFTNKMTDETAAHFFSIFTQYISNIARHGAVQDLALSRSG